MRGTDGITVGLTSEALSRIFSSDSTNATLAPVANQTASMTFANEWAIGRNMRRRSSGPMIRSCSTAFPS